MLLGEHSLCKHLKLSKGLHNPNDIQLLHKFVLRFLKQVVLLNGASVSLRLKSPEAQTSENILCKISKGVVEAGPIDEGKEETLDIRKINPALALEI